MVHKRARYPSERATLHQRVNVEMLSRTFITVNKLLRYTKLIIRIATITYTIYLNYVGISIISSLLITPALPLVTSNKKDSLLYGGRKVEGQQAHVRR